MSRRLPIITTLLCVLLMCSCGSSRKTSGYQIGIDPSWYPLQVAGQEKSILAFSIDLLVSIAKKENLELSVTNMSWDNLLWGLREKKYDAILSPMHPYTFYLKEYSFSDLYLLTGPVLVVPATSPFSDSNDLQGKMIGVVIGSSAALSLQKAPGVILRGFDSVAETLSALNDLQIEAAAIDILLAQDFARNLYPGRFKFIGHPLSEDGLRLISLFNKAAPLIKRFDKGLIALKKSGEYDALLRKWGLSPDEAPVANLDELVESFLKDIL